ncbi:MAG: type II toxin-antitoxin system RelE/ParE family toxin [Minisyncoccota bacterium]
MHIDRSRRFKKQYQKLPKSIQARADVRIRLFVADPFNEILRNHPLSGEYSGCRSINITGDYRIIYEVDTKSSIQFLLIGTHDELYG